MPLRRLARASQVSAILVLSEITAGHTAADEEAPAAPRYNVTADGVMASLNDVLAWYRQARIISSRSIIPVAIRQRATVSSWRFASWNALSTPGARWSRVAVVSASAYVPGSLDVPRWRGLNGRDTHRGGVSPVRRP
jgi:hypothetical protein